MMEWWLPMSILMPPAAGVVLALLLAGVMTGVMLVAVRRMHTSKRIRLVLLLVLLVMAAVLSILVWQGRREQPANQYTAEPVRIENLMVRDAGMQYTAAAGPEVMQQWTG